MKKEYNIQLVRNIVILFCLLFGFMLFFSLPVKAADVPYTPSGLKADWVTIESLNDVFLNYTDSIGGLYSYDAFTISETIINGRYGSEDYITLYVFDNCKPVCNSSFYCSPNSFRIIDPDSFYYVSKYEIIIHSGGGVNGFYNRTHTGYYLDAISYLYGVDVYLDDSSETLMVYANDKPKGDDEELVGGFVIPDYSDLLSSVDGSLSPIGELLKPDTSSDNVFGLSSLFDKVKNVFNNNTPSSGDSDSGLLFKLINSVQSGFEGILNFLKNFYSNIQMLLQNVINNIANQFNSLKEFFNSIKTVFDDLLNLGLDSDGNFSIALAIRRLLIPDDFSTFNNQLSTFINNIDASLGIKVYINSLKEFFNTIKTQNIPTITIPSFTIGGSTIPETVISFQFLVPYMGYIRAILSAFMWLAFILFCIKDFPNLLRGSFSTVEHSIGHVSSEGSQR